MDVGALRVPRLRHLVDDEGDLLSEGREDLVVDRLVHLRRERTDEVEEELDDDRLAGWRQRVAGGDRVERRWHELDSSSSVRHEARGEGVVWRRHEGGRQREQRDEHQVWGNKQRTNAVSQL